MNQLMGILMLLCFSFSAHAYTSEINSPVDLKIELQKIANEKNKWPSAAVYFANVYTQITDSIVYRIQNHQISDSGNMALLIIEFGKTFLHACSIRPEDLKKEGSLAWYNTFYSETHLSRMQQLQLAINAHINFDLPNVLAKAQREDRLPPRSDLDQIDECFENIAKRIFHNFIERTNISYKEEKKLNRYLIFYVYFGKSCRKKAYRFADKIAKGSWLALNKKNNRATRLSKKIIFPTYPVKTLLSLLRPYESSNQDEFIRDLIN